MRAWGMGRQRGRLSILAVVVLMVAALLSFGGLALAGHEESLLGSDFEIDNEDVDGVLEGANLTVDDDPAPSGRPSLDWANVAEDRKADVPSGSGDDSFGQGSKEDTAVPAVVAGSIPPNKSDLKAFGVYEEENPDGKFLHLFWTRVQDPKGTTNMDFEFNQSEVISANGVTPVRTAGDLLIVYELSKGGTVPNLFLFTWLDGTEGIDCEASNSYPCWGDRTDLTTAGAASGSINTVLIPAADADGLGDLDPRTFGEASIDLDFVFDPTACTSFGSAYLKSRSSDSFTAALKDFIAPLGVSITNCGEVTIRKVTSPSPDPFDTSFGFTSTVATDPAGDFPAAFSLKNGVSESSGVVLAGTGYTVTETDPSPAYALTDVDCSASDTGLVTDITGGTVTFDMVVGGTVDCTYTNTLQTGSLTVVKQTFGDVGTFPFTSGTLTPSSFDLTTTAEGELGEDSRLFDDLVPGTYDVSETVPDDWDLATPTCSDGSLVTAIEVGPNEDVTCTFVNTKRGKIIVDKVTNPSGSEQWFTFDASWLTDEVNDPDQDFSLQDGSTPFTSEFLAPDTYTVAENVPTGWTKDSANCTGPGADQDPSSIALGAGETWTCTFTNSTGAIQINKTTKNATLGSPQPLEGVTFEVRDGDILVATVVTDASGEACVGGLIVGDTYTVTETAAPAGYDPDAVASQDIAAAAAECDGAGTPAELDFENDPLSKITIGFESLAGAGVTVATSVMCTGPDAYNSGELGTLGDDSNPESTSITDLVEGTYTCVIVVDP